MKTRHQLSHKVADQTNEGVAGSPDFKPTDVVSPEPAGARSPSPPRLKSRRSCSASSEPNKSALASPSPPPGAKRPSTVQSTANINLPTTRVFPRRLCAPPEPISNKPQAEATERFQIARSQVAPSEKMFHLLLCVTGSVATVKLVELVQKIKSLFPRPYTFKATGESVEASIKIKIVMTQNAQHFANKTDLAKNLQDDTILLLDDKEEWQQWERMGDPVLHIELRKWADLCLIAPLDANTMAKMANGICDNLLTCVVRAWDVAKPLIYCPAMNVHMYNHPITREQLSKLQSYGYLRVDCVEKRLACGDIGMGGMASVETIATKVVECLYQSVPRKTSLTRPILCSQPTYPIISTTSDHQNFQPQRVDPIRTLSSAKLQSSLSNQILNRFRISNQISVHAVTNSRRSPLHNAADEDNGFDFDPSNMLEQSMITDDSNEVEPKHLMDNNDANDSDPTDISVDQQPSEGLAKLGVASPLYNTSKFLALCHNKDRGCYTCTICKHDYKNRKSMARHLKEQHVQGNIYHCKPCGVSYKRREKLIKHNRERHGIIQ